MTIERYRRPAACLALMFFLAATVPAKADVLSEMNRFWQGAAVNATGPTAFNGQASGHWTLGNLYLRAAGALRAGRHREPALVPCRLRRHRRRSPARSRS